MMEGALLVVESDLFSKLALNIAKNHTAVNEGVKKYFSIAYPHSQPPKVCNSAQLVLINLI